MICWNSFEAFCNILFVYDENIFLFLKELLTQEKDLNIVSVTNWNLFFKEFRVFALHSEGFD